MRPSRATAEFLADLHAPIDATLALHQMRTNQLPAQRRRIWMGALNDFIHLCLAVGLAWLKLRRQPSENDHPLLAAGRNLLQARAIKEIAQRLALPGFAILHLN